MENENVIHFKLNKEDGTNFTLDELAYILTTTKTALNKYYKDYCGIKNEDELKSLSPEIVCVANGCINISMVLQMVSVEVLSTIITIIVRKIYSFAKKKIISIVYKTTRKGKHHVNNSNSDELLNKIGASFFISYLYNILIDNQHLNWKKTKTSSNRIYKINISRDYWSKWLRKILEMDDRKLSTNEIGLDGNTIKKMASDLLPLV